jgi:hypothetical protein
MSCPRCGGIGWVCEQHPDRPMFHDNCPGPGEPCSCNPPIGDEPPKLPPGFKIDYDKYGSGIRKARHGRNN